MKPETRYTRSGDTSIAYAVSGDGPLDILFLPGWISQIEQLWEAPALRRFNERLTTFSRLIIFDRRGSGLSDRLAEEPTIEQKRRRAGCAGRRGQRTRSALHLPARRHRRVELAPSTRSGSER